MIFKFEVTRQCVNISYDKALEKAIRYCSYQERCKAEIEQRFVKWNVKKSDYNRLINTLIEENFFNKNRFVEAFVRGKFFIKKWGKNKIRMELYQKEIFDNKLIEKAFEKEIDTVVYIETLIELLNKKDQTIDDLDKKKKRDKLYRYIIGKGYESDLVSQTLGQLGY